MMDTKIIILAGGKGTRLKVNVPKPVLELNGKPMLLYILENIYKYNSSEEIIVLASLRNKRAIEKRIKSPIKITFCRHMKPIGTADAVRTVLKKIRFTEGNVLVLLADRPLISARTIKKLVKTHIDSNNVLTTLVSKVPNYNGFYKYFYYDGRIIRDKFDNIVGNLETNELSINQLNEIKEVFPSTYLYNKKWLEENIDSIKINPIKREYYLAQLLNIACSQGLKVGSVNADVKETLGINTQEQRILAEKIINSKQ